MVITGLDSLAKAEEQARGQQGRKDRGSGFHGVGSNGC